MQKEEQKTTEHTYSAFISHASGDREKAEQICASLENQGLRCWIAPRDVRAGKDYGEEIIHGIVNSKCLVLVLSEAANEAKFVRREVERAVSYGRPVFSIRVEEVLPSRSLELFVSSTHWIDAWVGDLIRHVDRLAKDITDESKLEDAINYSLVPSRGRNRTVWVVATAVTIAVLLTVVVGNYFSSSAPPVTNPPSVQAPVTNETNYYVAILDKFGGEFSGISKDDIELSIQLFGTKGHSIKMEFVGKGDLKALMQQVGIEYQNGSGEWIGGNSAEYLSIDSYKPDLLAQLETGEVTIRFNTTYLAPLVGRSGFIGPFTYNFNYKDDVLKAYKKRALKKRRWLKKKRSGEVVLDILGDIYPALKEARLGKSRGALSSSIRIENVPPLYNVEAIGRYEPRRDELPDNLGMADRVYIQMTFYDGSKSKIREFVREKIF